MMDSNRNCKRIHILVLYVCIAAIYLTHCDARKSMAKHGKRSKLVVKHFDVVVDSSNAEPYGVNSPFSLPPFDSLAPIPLPENAPPFCINPPFTSQTPPTSVPTPSGFTPPSPLLPLLSPPFYYIPPILPIQSPPPSPTSIVPSPPEFSFSPNPPEINPTPPGIFPSPPAFEPSPPIYVPSPPGSMLSPPSYEPSPPSYVPSPPSHVPTPGGGFVPSPPVFQPPVVFPPPTVPPPPQRGPNLTLWCVAKPTVPDPIIEEAMNYACGSGADCESIQPNGSCYQPNTLFAHASYAFNSYWQRTKVAGGTCEFGGTAMLVTVDPSYDGCHFLYY